MILVPLSRSAFPTKRSPCQAGTGGQPVEA
jgi:hypothetical protein